MSKDLYAEIVDYLVGTCKTETEAANVFSVTVDTVMRACSEEGIEMCAECGWWCDSSEIEENEYGEMVCMDCT